MHRRLWLNDPDCLMLRRTDTEMSADAVRTWAARRRPCRAGWPWCRTTWRCSTPTPDQLLDEVIDLGRAADDEARAGRSPRCPDLLDHRVPGRLIAAGHELVADPSVPTSTLRPPTSFSTQ